MNVYSPENRGSISNGCKHVPYLPCLKTGYAAGAVVSSAYTTATYWEPVMISRIVITPYLCLWQLVSNFVSSVWNPQQSTCFDVSGTSNRQSVSAELCATAWRGVGECRFGGNRFWTPYGTSVVSFTSFITLGFSQFSIKKGGELWGNLSTFLKSYFGPCNVWKHGKGTGLAV